MEGREVILHDGKNRIGRYNRQALTILRTLSPGGCRRAKQADLIIEMVPCGSSAYLVFCIVRTLVRKE